MSTTEGGMDEQEFLNCEMAFECPKNWFKLEPTANPNVKHCNTCNQSVHLCTTQEDLDKAIKDLRCIAFFKAPHINSRGIVYMTTGLPSQPRTSKLKTFLDEE